jgi:phage FluMu protein Com
MPTKTVKTNAQKTMVYDTWIVRSLNSPRGHIELECPHCKLVVIVHKIRWLRASSFTRRSCNGCMKCSWIPGRKK